MTDELFNNLVINPSVDSIQEFKIQKSQYPAEFGGKASALINVATRAGTNALHGSLFEFLRHDGLDAHNYFDPPISRFRRFASISSAAAGGPIVRTRTFFFGSFEGQRVRRSLTRTFSVPSGRCVAVISPGRADLRSAGDRSGDRRARRLRETGFPPAASIRWRRRSWSRCRCLRPRGAAEPDRGRAADPRRRSDQRARRSSHWRVDQIFARFSTFDADELQPFGTSSLQETLVPGFGRNVGTNARNLGVSHTRIFALACCSSYAAAGCGWTAGR